jgi:ostA family protein
VKITYDGKVGVANATGGVAISSPPRDLTASADTAVYETNNSGYIELIGNAKATQDGNTVEGNRLRLNNTSNKAEASGNVKIVYVPKPVEKKENVTADENAALQMAKAPVEVA